MTQAIIYTHEAGNSVVKDSLATAADGQNCRPNRCENCQGMLDSSRHKAWTGKRWISDRFATRRVANSIVAASKATTEKSSVVRAGWGALP